MKEEHIVLMEEEITSLEDFKEICIYEDEERKIFICFPNSKEQLLKQDILDRYNNEKYWNEHILKEFEEQEKIK